ncbi:MAG: hypothetical protein ACRCZW_10825 [Lactobacillaceae bacterium]
MPACGFDSFIADIGTEHLKKQFNCNIEIESVLILDNCKVNVTTWESLINSFNQKAKLGGQKTKEMVFNSDINSYVAKFRSSDHFITTRTQSLFLKTNNKTTKYTAYIKIGNFYNKCLYYLYGFILMNLCKFSCGRNLLLKYFNFFSRGFVVNQPSDEQIKKAKFKMLFTGVGMKNGEMISKNLEIIGPDPGYLTMSATINASFNLLLDLLKKRDIGENISNLPGGVLTPGFLFSECNYLRLLENCGICFNLKN